jgi:exosortase
MEAELHCRETVDLEQKGCKTMSDSTSVVAAKAPSRFSGKWLWLTQLLVMIGLLAILYHAILKLLILDWWTDPNFSHGFIVPLFAAFVVWHQRKRLATIPLAPSWWGLLVILGALATLIAGVLGVEYFLSRTSLVFLLGGFIIYCLGWGWFRALLFPWFCLFLMIPIPTIVFNQIAFPLQLLASKLASVLLPFVGVPVLRQGNVIQLPAMPLEVAEACSGIRSLVSLGTLAVIYGYFDLDARTLCRLLLALAAVPIAVAVNALRIVGTGLLVQYWDPDKALGFFHEFSGWVMFLLSIALLFASSKFIRLTVDTVQARNRS